MAKTSDFVCNILLIVTVLKSILIMVIWHWTYGYGPLRQRERTPAAATTWATLFI